MNKSNGFPAYVIYCMLLLLWSLNAYAAENVTIAAVVARNDHSLATYVLSINWQEFTIAPLVALVGGAVRTTISLCSRDKQIDNAFKETVKDGAVALCTGAICWVLIEVISLAWTPHAAMKAGFIFLAGYTRSLLVNWIEIAFSKGLDFILASLLSAGTALVEARTRRRLEDTDKPADTQPLRAAPRPAPRASRRDDGGDGGPYMAPTNGGDGGGGE